MENMEKIIAVLKEATDKKASDIFVVANSPASLKVYGRKVNSETDTRVFGTRECENFVRGLYSLANRDFHKLESELDDDFSIGIEDSGRFRVNAYKQKDSYACVLRTIPITIPDPSKINIPQTIMNFALLPRGLVLFTGTTGSGKTTSLACLVDKINVEKDIHLVTIEDPIEFRHKHKNSVISQRELEQDTQTFASGLRAAMRQAPDVILVGEMRDKETIETAITAAETGHLVFSTLHTITASATVDRIIDVFPPEQQNQIRTQLAFVLQAVVSQQLLPSTDGKIAPAFEILVANTAIRNLIRENKIFQIDNVIQTSAAQGMKTMDTSLQELLRKGLITKQQAINAAINPQLFMR